MMAFLDLRPLVCFYLFLSLLSVTFICTVASNGDRSYVFDTCLRSCLESSCSNITEFLLLQPAHLKLLSWTCLDECKYQCMWKTVDAFRNDGSNVPQFYGKWPFIRVAGIQEPAAMIFSLLNAASHLSIFYFRSKVPPTTHMFKVWHGMAFVAMMTWLCAAVFHTRDTLFTERMDYFSAFGLVLYNVFTLLCRVIGTSHKRIIGSIAVFLIALYCYHIHYMAVVNFDYGYNMLVNVAIGTFNGVGWILYSAYYWKTKPHVKKCLFVMLGLNALLLLELGDFPPLLWTFDAHAIWHGGTVPLSFLWYSFIIDDSLCKPTQDEIDDVKKII